MKRLLVAAVVAAGASLGPASPACACDCAPLTEAKAFEQADAVFAATLVRRDEPGGLIRSSTDPVALTWTVDAVYKDSAGTVQQVVTAGEAADQLSVAGRAGEPPAAAPERQRESDSTRWWPFAVGGGFAGLALAFWIVRRRARGAEGTPATGAV